MEHYKRIEEGRGNMGEAVERYVKEYAKEYVIGEKVIFVKNVMKNMKLTMEQALDALEIQGAEREQVISRLSE